jgi:hypothetical protein
VTCTNLIDLFVAHGILQSQKNQFAKLCIFFFLVDHVMQLDVTLAIEHLMHLLVLYDSFQSLIEILHFF